MTDDRLRNALMEMGVHMRYDYAWTSNEFGSKVDRLTGCCLRFLYLAQRASEADLHVRWLTEASTPYPTLEAALEEASKCLQMPFSTENAEDAQVIFAYLGPHLMGHVATTVAVEPNALYFFLIGDASCLAPCTGEEERLRGLSAFGLGQELQEHMEAHGYHAIRHHIVEYQESQYTQTLSAVMDSFSVPKSNLMIHTEKWVMYAPKSQEYNEAIDEEDNAYWREQAKGKMCDHCHESPPKLMRCVRCQNAYYCSKTCQKLAWKAIHKAECVSKS
ncbi:hypothetical protein THRCLA_07243 [Thraustotheca clavata]|uniref:MYND-type domain-containing protein n=1 Tax=Thraustotheca clavata TaxID=74557 RepID=A0A1V9ZFF3_9STRA|nr:hypothetical protein THRCLA_07243 [Thraustotheca clavata]